MRTYKVRPDKTTDGGTCFVAAFDDAPDIGVQGTTANEAVETLLSLAGKPPVTAPTPERRVGEADVFVPRMPSSVVQDEINYCTHKLDRTFRDEVDLRTYLYICQDWRDLRAANARLTAEVERRGKLVEEAADAFAKMREAFGFHDTRHKWCYELALKFRAALSLPAQTTAPPGANGAPPEAR